MAKKKKISKKVIAIAGTIFGLAVAGAVTGLVISGINNAQPPIESMQYSQEYKEALVTSDEGVTTKIDVATVESVDVNKSQTTPTEGEHGLGVWADVSSPEAFKNSTIGRCLDSDNYAGAQCWDLSNVFFENYAGRTFSTCGTGAAKGTLNCWEYNKGDEFEMVWNANDLQPGDIAVFTSGTWGHTGMIMGYPHDGYVTLLSQNQGGAPCPGGGSATNIINISLKDFGGAFRPKAFIKPPAPAPIPVPISQCIQWHVEHGDTMSKIMLECENTVVYGEAMDAYAKTWFSLYYVPGQSVYDGWHSKTGVGLYAGDDIEHRIK